MPTKKYNIDKINTKYPRSLARVLKQSRLKEERIREILKGGRN